MCIRDRPEMEKVWFADKEKLLAILRIYMGVGAKRRRKDFMYAKQIFELISFFFDGKSGERDEFILADDEVKVILNDYLAAYDHNDDNSMWFNKLKEIADKNGYASDMKAYKANPENFKGNVSDVAEVVRIAVTGRANTPDLWTIVHIMEMCIRDSLCIDICITVLYIWRFICTCFTCGFILYRQYIFSNNISIRYLLRTWYYLYFM